MSSNFAATLGLKGHLYPMRWLTTFWFIAIAVGLYSQPTWRGLYLYRSGDYMGDRNQEARRDLWNTVEIAQINYLILVGLTGEYPSMFDVYSEPGSVNKRKLGLLREFIADARQRGIQKIAIACSGRQVEAAPTDENLDEYRKLPRLAQAILQYNRLCQPNEKVDALSSELEWWNLSADEHKVYDEIERNFGFDQAEIYLAGAITLQYQHWLEALRQTDAELKQTNNGKSIELEVYLGYLSKDLLDDRAQCEQLTAWVDRVLLHVYTQAPEQQFRANYLSRNQHLQEAGFQGDIWPIFSLQSEALGAQQNYQGTHLHQSNWPELIIQWERDYYLQLQQKLPVIGPINPSNPGAVWFNAEYLRRLKNAFPH
jgi:hypothetical protein